VKGKKARPLRSRLFISSITTPTAVIVELSFVLPEPDMNVRWHSGEKMLLSLALYVNVNRLFKAGYTALDMPWIHSLHATLEDCLGAPHKCG
jgi:hypothetical protein